MFFVFASDVLPPARDNVDRQKQQVVDAYRDSAWRLPELMGTGLAMVGAYVLAGELAQAGGDHHHAFAAYEEQIRAYASISQKVNAGRLLAPRTRLGILARNAMFTTMSVFGSLVKILDRPATNIRLTDYDAVVARP